MTIVNVINTYIVYIAIVLMLVGTGMMIDINAREKTLDNEKALKKKRIDATILLVVGGLTIFTRLCLIYKKPIISKIRQYWGGNQLGPIEPPTVPAPLQRPPTLPLRRQPIERQHQQLPQRRRQFNIE